jgi:hypothetical protein
MQPNRSHPKPAARLPKPIKTTPMKRIGQIGPTPQKPPVPPGPNTEELIETLRQRINDLEARLAVLEGAVRIDGQDVVIASVGSVLIQAGSTVETTGSRVSVSAGSVETSTALASFTGVVTCDVITANSVVASSYTPGAGNLW